MEKKYNLCALIGFSVVLVSVAAQALIMASVLAGVSLASIFRLSGTSGRMVLGLFYMMGGLLRFIGLILAIVALVQIKKSHEKGKVLAWIAIGLIIAFWILPFIFLIANL